MSAANEKLIVGKISGVYGVKGWIKVYSETDPREGIADYNPWYIKQGSQGKGEWREVQLEQGRRHAKTVIAKLEGVDDRDAAMLLTGVLIAIRPDQLQALSEDRIQTLQEHNAVALQQMKNIAEGKKQTLVEQQKTCNGMHRMRLA